MAVRGVWPRRVIDLSPEDAALVNWAGDGYPPALAPVMERFRQAGMPTLNVGQGWWPLLQRVDAQIAAIAPDYRVVRLAEEIGVLDLQIHPDDLSEDIENLIDNARYGSARTCEICADRGFAYRQGDWLITLCIDHARAREARPARTDADILEASPRPTDREFAFALSAGIPASAFSAQARRENEAYLQACAEADEAEMASWMTTAEIARLMGCTSAEVTRLREEGALSAGRRRNGRYAFPRWQLDRQNRPLAGLQIVLAVLSHEDPMSVSNMMTASFEELDGLAPAQWMARQRPVAAVTQALNDWREM